MIDERKAKKASGSLNSPEKFADQPARSLASADERADGENDQGVSTFDRRPQLTDNREEVAGGSRMRADARLNSRETGVLRTNGCARPVTPDVTIGADRANRHALED